MVPRQPAWFLVCPSQHPSMAHPCASSSSRRPCLEPSLLDIQRSPFYCVASLDNLTGHARRRRKYPALAIVPCPTFLLGPTPSFPVLRPSAALRLRAFALKRPLTGGSRGIGLACLRLLLDSPFHANLLSLSRSFPSELRQLSQTYPDRLKVVIGDVKNSKDIQTAVETAIKTFGAIDGLVLNAGLFKLERIIESNSLEYWKQVFDVNFFSLVTILNHALNHLRNSNGRVVFISSGAAVSGTAAWGSYNASKAAMNSLCKTLATEEPTITSIALRPGTVDTQMQTELRAKGKDKMDAHSYKRFADLFESSNLLPVEVPAQVIANLVTKADKTLTGQFLSWDSNELKNYRGS
ncbi:hypothetical protein O181_103289 [Austropuccinia psidii MF-1]|uniref:Short-chain dehydrogenase n=1 Tax=Austropuccinia psidii MF-1 TaxID=1389203 RepID=A0A9Q3JKX9_9BASI|nr:hypothetical protein [Austropuccinia psidii MF-1]